MKSLKDNLTSKRDTRISESLAYSKMMCEELEIEPTRPYRIRKSRNSDHVSQTPPLSLGEELERDMNTNMNRVLDEITTRSQQVFDIAEEYQYLLPKNLLDLTHEAVIDEQHTDFDHQQFHQERTRLQTFVSAAKLSQQLRGADPLELLQFIQKYNRRAVRRREIAPHSGPAAAKNVSAPSSGF